MSLWRIGWDSDPWAGFGLNNPTGLSLLRRLHSATLPPIRKLNMVGQRREVAYVELLAAAPPTTQPPDQTQPRPGFSAKNWRREATYTTGGFSVYMRSRWLTLPTNVPGCTMAKGVYVKSVEHRAKLAAATKLQMQRRREAGQAAPNLGVKFSEQARANMAQARLGNKNAFRHGWVNTPTHNTWRDMLARCRQPSNPSYVYYAARGISVCEHWQLFENFLADMGERPLGHTLDRLDNDGNYEPSNCRWATPKQQAANRRPRREVMPI